jgi:hypothetical protein
VERNPEEGAVSILPHVQTSNNKDIEFVASIGNRDIILIYTKISLSAYE